MYNHYNQPPTQSVNYLSTVAEADQTRAAVHSETDICWGTAQMMKEPNEWTVCVFACVCMQTFAFGFSCFGALLLACSWADVCWKWRLSLLVLLKEQQQNSHIQIPWWRRTLHACILFLCISVGLPSWQWSPPVSFPYRSSASVWPQRSSWEDQIQ